MTDTTDLQRRAAAALAKVSSPRGAYNMLVQVRPWAELVTELLAALSARETPPFERNGIRIDERVVCVDVPCLIGTVVRCAPDGVDVQWDDGRLGELVWDESVAYNAYRLQVARAARETPAPSALEQRLRASHEREIARLWKLINAAEAEVQRQSDTIATLTRAKAAAEAQREKALRDWIMAEESKAQIGRERDEMVGTLADAEAVWAKLSVITSCSSPNGSAELEQVKYAYERAEAAEARCAELEKKYGTSS